MQATYDFTGYDVIIERAVRNVPSPVSSIDDALNTTHIDDESRETMRTAYEAPSVLAGYLSGAPVSEQASEDDMGGLEARLVPAIDAQTLDAKLDEFTPFEGARKALYYEGVEFAHEVDAIDIEDDALYVVSYERDGERGYAVLTAEQAATLETEGYEVVNYRLDAIPERRINELQAGFYGFIAHFTDEYVINEGVADRPDTQRQTAVHELGHYHTPNFFMSHEAYEQLTLLMTSTATNKEMPRSIREPDQMIPSFAEVYGRTTGYLGQRS